MGVYLVGREGAPKDELPRIVEARTAASAIAHASKRILGATLISTKEAMAWAGRGVNLEVAGEAETTTKAKSE